MHKTPSHYGLPLVLAALVGCLTSGCRHRASYQSFGAQIVEVDRGSKQAASAVYETHREMKGSPFSDQGRTWSDGGDLQGAIAETTFRSAAGAECVITRVTVKGRPLLVLLKSTDDKTCMELHNTFVSNLVRHGVKPRKTWHKQLIQQSVANDPGQDARQVPSATGHNR